MFGRGLATAVLLAAACSSSSKPPGRGNDAGLDSPKEAASPVDSPAPADVSPPGGDAPPADVSPPPTDTALPVDVAAPTDAAGAADSAAPEAGCMPSACAVPVCLLVSSPDAGACAAGSASTDSDGDGLSDAWEQAGYVDMNCNGVLDAGDIALPGADPQRKDLYVRYDYMASADHSHQPPQRALDQVAQAFAAHGIALHWIAPAGSIAERQVTTRDSAATAACAGADFVTMKTLRAAAFAPIAAALGPNLQHPAYHYLVFAHNATLPDTALDGSACPIDPECGGHPDPTNSGSSDIGGDDVIVAFGYYVDSGFPIGIETWAGTILHELGHNLGLKHGSLAAAAPQTCDTYKPNYISVMGYSYQDGIQVAAAPGSASPMPCSGDADCNTGVCATASACHCTDDLGDANVCYRVDYAGTKLLDLDETSLDERVGVGGPSADQDIVVYCGIGVACALYGPSHGAIDWNRSGDIQPSVQADIDNNGSPSNLLATTTDWDKLAFTFQCSASWGAGAPGERAAAGTSEPGRARASGGGLVFGRSQPRQ
jgi:hypothetical protein